MTLTGIKKENNSGRPVFILGIDPGSINAGYAVIKAQNRSFSVVNSGVCQLNSKTPFLERLPLLFDFFNNLCDPLIDFEVSIEALAFVKNPNSFGKLAQARGAILAALGSRPQSISEYSPNLVKSTVSGYGLASKQSLEKSLGFACKKKMNYTTNDESDAIALAICHHYFRSTNLPPTAGRSPFHPTIIKGKRP